MGADEGRPIKKFFISIKSFIISVRTFKIFRKYLIKAERIRKAVGYKESSPEAKISEKRGN